MSEIRGEWYLYYKEFDNMENREPEITDKVRLLANTSEEAYREAKELWEFRLSTGTYDGYNGRAYPQSPSIHQIIDVEQDSFDVILPKGKPFSWEALHSDDIEFRNRLVAAIKHEGTLPDADRIHSFIHELGMKAQAEKDGLLAQKDLEHDWRWTVRFTFNPNQALRNIFVYPKEYLPLQHLEDKPSLQA